MTKNSSTAPSFYKLKSPVAAPVILTREHAISQATNKNRTEALEPPLPEIVKASQAAAKSAKPVSSETAQQLLAIFGETSM